MVVGCKNYTLKVIDLNTLSINSSCCTNLPEQSVRDFGPRQSVSLEVACDEEGYVVVGSSTNKCLSVFSYSLPFSSYSSFKLIHTFSLNDYYVSSMCLEDGRFYCSY